MPTMVQLTTFLFASLSNTPRASSNSLHLIYSLIRIEGSPEGGSTSNSDSREGDRDREATNEEVEDTRVGDDPSRVNATAEMQTTGAHEASDNSEDLGHTSKQGGGCLVPTVEDVPSEALSSKTNDSSVGTIGDPSEALSSKTNDSSGGTVGDPSEALSSKTNDLSGGTVGDPSEALSSKTNDSSGGTVGDPSEALSSKTNDSSGGTVGDPSEALSSKTNDSSGGTVGDPSEALSSKTNDSSGGTVGDPSEALSSKTNDSSGGTVGDPSEALSSKTNDSSGGTVGDPSGQEGLPVVPTSNGDDQQTSEDWTLVYNMETDAGTAGKGEVSRPMEEHSGSSIEVKTCTPVIVTKDQDSLHSDDTPEDLKNDRFVVAKCSEAEGKVAADNEIKDVQAIEKDAQAIEMDAQAMREGSCEVSAATSQGLQSSLVAENFATRMPDLVDSKAQGVEMLCHSKSPRETLKWSNSLKETSASEEPLCTLSVSGSQKGMIISSEAPKTVAFSETEKKTDKSQEDLITMSASAAQEESSEFVKASSTVLNSETEKTTDASQEDPRAVSRSESLEVSNSPRVASEVLPSEAQARSGVISEAPTSPPTSGAEIVGISEEASSVVFNSSGQKDVDSIVELSTSDAQDEVSTSSEASRMVSNSEVLKAVGISTDSPSTVPTSEAEKVLSKSSETSNMVPNPEVQKGVGISADASSRACEVEEELSASSEAPRAPSSTAEAQKDVGTSREEIISGAEVPSSSGSAPEGLQRKPSQIGEEQIRNLLQNPPQLSETNVCDVRKGLSQARSEEGKEMSVVEGNARESDNSLTSTRTFLYEEELAKKDKTIADLRKEADLMEALSNHFRGELHGLEQDYDALRNNFQELGRTHTEVQRNHKGLQKTHQELQRTHQELSRAYMDKEAECGQHAKTAQSYARSYHRLKDNMTKENNEKEKVIIDLRGQLEQMKQEYGNLQSQMSLYEQQHASEQSRGGSYLDDTKAATPALLVSAMNGVKDASNNFVKVLKSSIQAGFDAAQLEKYIGAVSRNGHVKFQYQAYICRLLFDNFDLPYSGSSKDVLPPTTYFLQYQMHDLKKTDTVERLLHYDRDIDESLHEFCFRKFLELMEDIEDRLTDRGIGLTQQVKNKQHPQDSKLYVSFCKVAVSVWLLQRLAFSFLHPAKPFIAGRGEPFDLNRMQSVVPLDEPSADEEVQLRVGFYVLPGFDIGNSAIPCEVYVALK